MTRRWIIGLGIFALVIILLDEWAYYNWKTLNRGEHWSHLMEKTGLQNWNETNIGTGQLNYSRPGGPSVIR